MHLLKTSCVEGYSGNGLRPSHRAKVSLTLRQAGPLSWDIVPVFILSDESRAQHIGESLLLFGRHLGLGLDIGKLLLEAVNRAEFVGDRLLLRKSSNLSILDLLFSASS